MGVPSLLNYRWNPQVVFFGGGGVLIGVALVVATGFGDLVGPGYASPLWEIFAQRFVSGKFILPAFHAGLFYVWLGILYRARPAVFEPNRAYRVGLVSLIGLFVLSVGLMYGVQILLEYRFLDLLLSVEDRLAIVFWLSPTAMALPMGVGPPEDPPARPRAHLTAILVPLGGLVVSFVVLGYHPIFIFTVFWHLGTGVLAGIPLYYLGRRLSG